VVRRIFEAYAKGDSPRTIAAALNRDSIASPGSSWKRVQKRSQGWMMSAIAGDSTRGIGILNNELYVGRVIWNRFRWVRSAADSSRRRCVPNPRSEWVAHEDERLRVVPQTLWDRVKERQSQRSDTIGERVKRGLSRDSAKSTVRGPKFLFSGLLKYGRCGANYTIANATSYGCASYVNGRACDNDAFIRRDVVEAGALEGIKRDLNSPGIFEESAPPRLPAAQRQGVDPRRAREGRGKGRG
jgi:site-specific DNA recombinase